MPWLERINRLITQGREVNIFSIISTSSVSGASGRLAGSMSNRIILRQTDPNVYRSFGVPTNIIDGLVLNPGQGLTASADLVQIGALCTHNKEKNLVTFEPNKISQIAEHLTGTVANECRTSPLGDQIKDLLPLSQARS